MLLSAKKTSFTAALAVLSVALPFGSVAFAQAPATIADAERAAQRVIVDQPSPAHSQTVISGTSSTVTLAGNERAAQRAIVDSPLPGSAANANHHATFGGATLASNERAAQEAIVGNTTRQRDAVAYRGHAAGGAMPAADENAARGN